MTEIEQKALALVNEVIQEVSSNTLARLDPYNLAHEAVRRAIEQHEAFKREVSDEIAKLGCWPDTVNLQRFILPKPDPLVAALVGAFGDGYEQPEADNLRAALAKRGLEVREIEG